MLCDRCVSNAKCDRFTPGSKCVLEQETFNKVVAELAEKYDLDSVADKILVGRAGMYLIHIMRAEAYEATVGMNEKTAYWGAYIGRMDSMLKGLFNDLAISRGKRMNLEKGDGVLVDFDEILRKLARVEQKDIQSQNKDIKMRRFPCFSARSELLTKWENDYVKLRATLKRGKKTGGKKTKTI